MEQLFKISSIDNILSYIALTGYKLLGIVLPKCS